MSVSMKTIRIGCGQGFWGDSLEAPIELIRRGPLDYLVLDYLAEVTMSILARHKQKRPEAGYARDFIELMERVLPELVQRKIKVLANAGGMNPLSCARALAAVAKKHGLQKKVKIAVIQGDDILARVDELHSAGETFSHLASGRLFSEVRPKVRSANVYLGAEPLTVALAGGADIVITGRVADPALVLAPLVHEFSWGWNEWDKLSAGVVAGHVIECGAQCTGGNCSADWETIPQLADIGYPVLECRADGSFVVTKHANTGGRVDARSVKEQLVYEIDDPKRYITPDVIADFTSLELEDLGGDRVEIRAIRGTARPEKLKVSMSYDDGFLASGTLLYSWPNAREKAAAAEQIIRERLSQLGLTFEKIYAEAVGANACFGATQAASGPDPLEVMFRIAVKGQDIKAVERFTREIAPLVLNGPPSATSYFGSKGSVQEVVAYWPALIGREKIQPQVSFYSEAE